MLKFLIYISLIISVYCVVLSFQNGNVPAGLGWFVASLYIIACITQQFKFDKLKK